VLTNLKFEQKHLRAHLEKFTIENFNQLHKDWLKSGRCVWYICGNISSEKCIEMVEEARKKFELATIKIEELPELRAVALDGNTSFHLEIPLEDKSNENSCNLTYFEVGPIGESTKEKLINDIVMQCLDEPFYADLRTK
jgi:secreted Zn-dependent insulinase-like peptidase